MVLDHQKKDVCLQTYFSSLTCNPHWGKKSILSFHCCICQVPSLALCLVLLLLVSLFIRCDRFSLIPFLRIFPRFFSFALFLYGKEAAVVPSSASDCVPFFLPFPIVNICLVLPPSCFSLLFWLETKQCVHMYQKNGHKWSILVTGILLPAVSSIDRSNLL